MFNANYVDPDRNRSVSFDLYMHCLQNSLLWDVRHRRVDMTSRWRAWGRCVPVVFLRSGIYV